MSNVSEPREWIVKQPGEDRNVLDWTPIEPGAFESMRKSFDTAVEIANQRGKDCDALTKERDEWKRDFQDCNADRSQTIEELFACDDELQQMRKERDELIEIRKELIEYRRTADKARNAALAERDNALQLTVSMASERAELRARLDAQRLINEAQAKAGQEAFLDARKTALAHLKELTFRAEQLTIANERADTNWTLALQQGDTLELERARTQVLVEALNSAAILAMTIHDATRDHKSLMDRSINHDANLIIKAVDTVLAAHRAQEGEE